MRHDWGSRRRNRAYRAQVERHIRELLRDTKRSAGEGEPPVMTDQSYLAVTPDGTRVSVGIYFAPPPPPPPEPPIVASHLFAANAIWNTPVALLPLHPNNDDWSKSLAAAAVVSGTSFLATNFGVPIYTVDDTTPRRKITVTGEGAARKQIGFNDVPVPPGARPAAGSDAHMCIYHPTMPTFAGAGVAWDMWDVTVDSDGTINTTRGAGRMLGVDTNPGWFRLLSDPADKTHYNVEIPTFGVRGSAFPLLGGVVRIQEALDALAEIQAGRRGCIPHRLAMCVPSEINANFGLPPAHRHDGSRDGRWGVPEGALTRLDPTVDLSRLSLNPLERMLADAWQSFGAQVADGGGHLGFYGEIDTVTGGDAWAPLFDPKRAWTALSDNFPWEHVQVVQDPSASTAASMRRSMEERIPKEER